jgi:hypothetical protein
MELELHQGDALDVLAFDVFDAGDVKKVILEVISEKPLHLLRIHAAVGLGDVDDRRVEIGKDVDRHAEQREHRAEDSRGDAGPHRDRMPHREYDWIHRRTTPGKKGTIPVILSAEGDSARIL